MSTKPYGIDDFGYVVKQKLRKYWPVRTIGRGMIAIALIAIALTVLRIHSTPSAQSASAGPRLTTLAQFHAPTAEEILRMEQRPARTTEEIKQTEERINRLTKELALQEELSPFAIMGHIEIDEGIVKTARQIDEKIIHNPFGTDASRLAVIGPLDPTDTSKSPLPIPRQPDLPR